MRLGVADVRGTVSRIPSRAKNTAKPSPCAAVSTRCLMPKHDCPSCACAETECAESHCLHVDAHYNPAIMFCCRCPFRENMEVDIANSSTTWPPLGCKLIVQVS